VGNINLVCITGRGDRKADSINRHSKDNEIRVIEFYAVCITERKKVSIVV